MAGEADACWPGTKLVPTAYFIILNTKTYYKVTKLLFYLSKTSCKEHTFEQLSHFFKEFVYKRPFQYVHLMNCPIYLYWYNKICITDWLKYKSDIV